MAKRIGKGDPETNSKGGIRVALVVPRSDVPLSDFAPPLNLGYIASYLRKTLPNAEVRIFDGSTGTDPEKSIHDFKPNVVGVTATTPQAPAAYRLGDAIRKNYSGILTVMGGIHATIMAEEALKHFDVVIKGEGEKTFAQIVKRFQNTQPQHCILEGEPVENLDEIPSPAFDLINLRNYFRRGINLPNLITPIGFLVTSRGCPYRCAFCWNSFRKTKVRYFSAKRIVEEILFLRKEYGINSIFFMDDEFLINRQRIDELSALFKQYEISKWLRWGTQVRATTVTVPLLRIIKNMGCVVLSIGLESGTKRILDYLKSGSATLETNEKALDLAAQIGITTGGSFIFGTPTETLNEMKQTFNWALNHPNLSFIGISILGPFPGTKVWDLCIKKGLLPSNINYEKLWTDVSSDINTYLVSAVPRKDFIRFIKDISKTAWLISQIRSKPSIKKFLFIMGFPSVWKIIANHPQIVIKELFNIVKIKWPN